ncbi:roundabout homolog 2-like [Cherax quadricarinatus]|uniref:roundabout homolog 2-like n=1 Tax=Cherax quadricarinatus TaxID=27406 RepID=UPI00387E6583
MGVQTRLLLLLIATTSKTVNGRLMDASLEEGIAPVILEEPTEEIVRRNDPLTLYCKASGMPAPRILWYRTDSQVALRDRDSRLQLPDGSLFFYRVRGRDRGTYYCVATNIAGTASSRKVTLQMACEYRSKDTAVD